MQIFQNVDDKYLFCEVFIFVKKLKECPQMLIDCDEKMYESRLQKDIYKADVSRKTGDRCADLIGDVRLKDQIHSTRNNKKKDV